MPAVAASAKADLHDYTNAPEGLCEDVLTHPCIHASYVVSVRQYRSLQSRFLQFSGRPEQPCGLLMRINALHIRDLHPLDNQTNFPAGKYSCHAGHTQQL